MSMQTRKITRIFPIRNLSDAMSRRIMEGLAESAKVWNFCLDLRTQDPSPLGLAEFHAATRGRFSLYAQSVQQVFRAFHGCISMTETKLSRDIAVRHPHKKKRVFPLMWPSQTFHASSPDLRRLVLPMGRGRPSICLDVPSSFPKRDHIRGLKIVWKRGLELHVLLDAPQEPPVVSSGIKARIDAEEAGLARIVTDD